MALKVGDLLQQRYAIQEAIKSGGMGSVFLAYDSRLEGLCAVKEMHPSEDEWAHRRFREEATTLSKLQHAGIPKVRDFFVQDSLHYLVMDYVAGNTLQEEVGMSGEQARQDLLELLSILEYLHGLDPCIIHRDIKPSNLIRDSQNKRLNLVDFGLARSLSDNTQTTAGTVMFCSPEQMVGKSTERSDLYSVAATFYVLLTGLQIQMGSCKPILFHRPDLAPELALTIDTALQLDPQQRYASAREMRQALLSSLPAPPPTPRSGRKLALAGAILACAGGLWWSWPQPPPDAPPLSPTPSPKIQPKLVSVPEQAGWGKVVKEGDDPEELLEQVVQQTSLLGFSGPRCVIWEDGAKSPGQVGIVLSESVAPPKGLTPFRLPDGRMAQITHLGSYQELAEKTGLLRQWILSQGLKPGKRFYELRRINESNQPDAQRWETDLCWPIRK